GVLDGAGQRLLRDVCLGHRLLPFGAISAVGSASVLGERHRQLFAFPLHHRPARRGAHGTGGIFPCAQGRYRASDLAGRLLGHQAMAMALRTAPIHSSWRLRAPSADLPIFAAWQKPRTFRASSGRDESGEGIVLR
ncbi:MAG: hypothetical protein SLRJCFUN_001866, partial [Candidatus Fervidibacter sp.]